MRQLVVIGRAFEEYNYLPNSLTTFPDAPALKAIMEEVGWRDVRFYRVTGGIVAVHVGTKAWYSVRLHGAIPAVILSAAKNLNPTGDSSRPPQAVACKEGQP